MSNERKKGKVFVLTDRKNHKALLETIPDKLITLLKDYIEYFDLKENDLLFFKKSPIPPETLRRNFDKYIKLAGVPRITPHQFRHTLASVIFASGNSKIEDAYVVAQRLGHNVKYTLDTYGSLFKEREIDIMNNLDL
jgi:integrase